MTTHLIDGSQYLVASLCTAVLFTSAIFLIVVATWQKKEKAYRLANLYLFSFFLLVCLQMFEILSFQFQLIHRAPHLINVFDPYIALAPFFIYAYLREINGFSFSNIKLILPHMIPALVVFLLNIPAWMLGAEDKLQFALHNYYLENRPLANLAPSADETMLFLGLIVLLYWWQLRRYTKQSHRNKRAIKQLSKNVNRLVLLNGIVLISLGLVWSIPGTYLMLLAMFIVDTGYFLYYFLTDGRLPKPVASKPARATKERVQQGQYTDDVLAAFNTLKQSLEKGAYRDNDISLRTLADDCGLSTHLVSKAINECTGQNFYDWVNEYRVNDAKRLLIEKPGANVSPICYEVGFNTKSTFYKAFKKIEGLTPNEYRKRQAQS